MNIKHFFKNKTDDEAQNARIDEDKLSDNPYLQSRALWQDIYGNAEDRYRASRRLNQWLAALVGLSLIGVIYIGAQSKLVPYVVEMMNGQVIYTGVADQSNFAAEKGPLANYFIQQFVQGARGVSVDGTIEKDLQAKAFALSKGLATTTLGEFYKQRDPYQVVQKRTIGVEINYVNTLPNHVIEVGWTEVSRNSATGEALYQERYVGQFDYVWDQPSQSESILQHNPFGFYITNIAWTGVKSS